MALIIKIETAFDLRGEFRRFGREDQFSADGYIALIDYFEELEDVELDVISLCCNFTESSIEEFINDYRLSPLNPDDTNSIIELVLDYIETHGYWFQFLDHDQRIIYQAF